MLSFFVIVYYVASCTALRKKNQNGSQFAGQLISSMKYIVVCYEKMNGPQRTACLAKGCINNQYQLTIPRQWASSMVTSLAMLHVRQTEHRQTDRQYAILSLASSQNFCQAMNGPLETACVTKMLNVSVSIILPARLHPSLSGYRFLRHV